MEQLDSHRLVAQEQSGCRQSNRSLWSHQHYRQKDFQVGDHVLSYPKGENEHAGKSRADGSALTVFRPARFRLGPPLLPFHSALHLLLVFPLPTLDVFSAPSFYPPQITLGFRAPFRSVAVLTTHFLLAHCCPLTSPGDSRKFTSPFARRRFIQPRRYFPWLSSSHLQSPTVVYIAGSLQVLHQSSFLHVSVLLCLVASFLGRRLCTFRLGF